MAELRFKSPRLLIRPFTSHHISAAYIRGLNDVDYMRYSSQSLVRHTWKSEREYVRSFDLGDHVLLAILAGPDCREIVGSITLIFGESRDVASLGLFVIPEFSGQGFGLEAVRAVSSGVLEAGIVTRLEAGTASPNVAMQRILEGADFSCIGRKQSVLETRSGVHDALLYRRCRSSSGQDRKQ